MPSCENYLATLEIARAHHLVVDDDVDALLSDRQGGRISNQPSKDASKLQSPYTYIICTVFKGQGLKPAQRWPYGIGQGQGQEWDRGVWDRHCKTDSDRDNERTGQGQE